MIGDFFAWWFGQLADLLPSWLRQSALTQTDALLITPLGSEGNGRIRVGQRRNGKVAALGEVALDAVELKQLPWHLGQQVVLQLTRADVLERSLTLPLAAQSDLDQVLAFEMDRETPFTADELYWNHSVETIDREHGRLSVRLLLKLKTDLAPLLAMLAAVGVVPRWAEIADAPQQSSCLPLGRDRGRPQERARRLVRPLAVGCAMLALGAAATPFLRQSVTLASLDRELRAGQPKAAEAAKLRADIDRLSRGAELLKGEVDKTASALAVLANVTQLLPDDTHLTELELHQRKVTLTGRSASAARLISTLAANGQLKNPTFGAPVTRLEGLHTEVFTIVAEVGTEF